MKTIQLGEIFTEQELKRALYLKSVYSGTTLRDELKEKIVMPAMPKINEKTGQENDPLYWAYALIYVLDG
jgi:hypothetical protein